MLEYNYLFTCCPPLPDDRSNRVCARSRGNDPGLKVDAHSRAAAYSSSEYGDSEADPLRDGDANWRMGKLQMSCWRCGITGRGRANSLMWRDMTTCCILWLHRNDISDTKSRVFHTLCPFVLFMAVDEVVYQRCGMAGGGL